MYKNTIIETSISQGAFWIHKKKIIIIIMTQRWNMPLMNSLLPSNRTKQIRIRFHESMNKTGESVSFQDMKNEGTYMKGLSLLVLTRSFLRA